MLNLLPSSFGPLTICNVGTQLHNRISVTSEHEVLMPPLRRKKNIFMTNTFRALETNFLLIVSFASHATWTFFCCSEMADGATSKWTVSHHSLVMSQKEDDTIHYCTSHSILKLWFLCSVSVTDKNHHLFVFLYHLLIKKIISNAP